MLNDINPELYKSLRGEVNVWVSQIPHLWLQKLVLVGAAVAWIIAGEGGLGGWADALGVAWIAVPLLAIAIDLKILSYALQGRMASAFLAEHSDEVTKQWESASKKLLL